MSLSYERTIFQTGEYVHAFQPEESYNPFRHLYARKRLDVLKLAPELLAGKPDARVLDIGGGMGRIALPLARQYQVHLADISPAMLDLARNAAQEAALPPERLQTSVVDASKPLPFEAGSFDLIVCLDLLVHLPDPQVTVRELYRVLRPGGVALIDATNSMPLWVFCYPRYVGKRPKRWAQTSNIAR